MSEAAEEITEVSNDAPANENQTTETENPNLQVVKDDKPAGYYPVEIEDPAIKQRFDYVYGQVKKNERDKNEYKRIAAQQSAIIAQLQQDQGAIVNHLQTQTYTNVESQLNDQFKAAYETGDTNALVDIQRKLIKLEAQKLVQPQRQPAQQQQFQEQPVNYTNFNQISNEAVADGDITLQEQQQVNAWAGETNERGEQLRPWLINSTGDPNDPDPDYVKAWTVANQVWSKPQYAHLTFDQKLAEVDKRMGVSKSTAKQSVMGGGLQGKPRSARISLSPEAERIALKTRFGEKPGGPKKTDEQILDAYRKQMDTVKSSKGSRK